MEIRENSLEVDEPSGPFTLNLVQEKTCLGPGLSGAVEG